MVCLCPIPLGQNDDPAAPRCLGGVAAAPEAALHRLIAVSVVHHSGGGDLLSAQ
jgi:hypothetical protein